MISVIASEVITPLLSPKQGNGEAPGGKVMRFTFLFRQMFIRNYLRIEAANMGVE